VFECSSNYREWQMFLYGSSSSGNGVFALFALSSNGSLFLEWISGFRKWMLDFEPQRSTGAQLSSFPRLSPRQYHWMV
jgi:hypothetical protein